MRRSKLPPRSLYPLKSTSPSLDTEKRDDKFHQSQLPPIKDNSFLFAPPLGRPECPQYGRRAHRLANGRTDPLGLHPSKYQSQAMASAAPSLTSQTPTPWGTDEPFRCCKDFLEQKSSTNVRAKIQLPDILDTRCQMTGGHLRIRPANTDLLILNEIEYNYEPAVVPRKISPEFSAINGRRLRIKSPRIRTQLSRANSYHTDVDSQNIHSGNQSKATRSGTTNLPHLDLLLKKRHLS
ncbi:uncharacterized protein LOC124116903 [Haliotis rufescens]|uniref:uncharacterized protein LOC124116903 n=1 Tax=Haliotis rufescens TaxID=6454 RepID=UPI001EB06D12|nr:uncharacterized protein LOC124116903 [Haliotis rufescens]